jgi:hypothetical protein
MIYIYLAIFFILLSILYIKYKKESFHKDLPNTIYSKRAIKGNLILPPEKDYKLLYGDTLKYINKGYDVKQSIILSYNKNRDVVYRKIERVNCAILIYLNNNRIDCEKDIDLNREILSALVLLSENDRYKLMDMCKNPQKYIKKENKEKEIDYFIELFSNYHGMRNGIKNRLKIYEKKKSWLYTISENRIYKNNNTARYFWMNLQVILNTPVIFCRDYVPKYKESVNELVNLIEQSFTVDKSKLIKIDFFNDYI